MASSPSLKFSILNGPKITPQPGQRYLISLPPPKAHSLLKISKLSLVDDNWHKAQVNTGLCVSSLDLVFQKSTTCFLICCLLLTSGLGGAKRFRNSFRKEPTGMRQASNLIKVCTDSLPHTSKGTNKQLLFPRPAALSARGRTGRTVSTESITGPKHHSKTAKVERLGARALRASSSPPRVCPKQERKRGARGFAGGQYIGKERSREDSQPGNPCPGQAGDEAPTSKSAHCHVAKLMGAQYAHQRNGCMPGRS
jgi:hypothetical protein